MVRRLHEREGLPVQVHNAMSAGHNDAFALSPAAQCSIDPPGKCPPPWINVILSSSNLSPCQNLMQGSGCLTHLNRWHGDGRDMPNARPSRLASEVRI
jgi:hypothetical protein